MRQTTGLLTAIGLGLVLGTAQAQKLQQPPRPLASETPRRLNALLGGGNFDNGNVNESAKAKFQLLQTLGGTLCRVNLYPGVYLLGNDWNRPNSACLDAIMQTAHQVGVTPVILFEFYSDYEIKGSLKLGTYAQWFQLGKAFAARYRPDGTWGREHGVKNWGVSIYTAINEPDGGDFRAGGAIGPVRYAAALKGLADGAHSVARSLRVLPGGFLSPNAYRDWTLRGIGPVLAPLWNDGTLDGIDLHTYYDVQYAPMEKTYERSAQNNFDMVKKACGITRDLHFYATEFNYKKRLVDEAQAAKGFLTGLWDNMGVVKNDGKTGATAFAFPWNVFNDASKDVEFGMRLSFAPLEMAPRGEVLQRVMRLTQGMDFQRRDPRGTGEYLLTGGGRKLWVWQDREGWTNHPGHAFMLSGVPKDAKHLEVYGWDGLRTTRPLSGKASVTVEGLAGEETYMFLAK